MQKFWLDQFANGLTALGAEYEAIRISERASNLRLSFVTFSKTIQVVFLMKHISDRGCSNIKRLKMISSSKDPRIFIMPYLIDYRTKSLDLFQRPVRRIKNAEYTQRIKNADGIHKRSLIGFQARSLSQNYLRMSKHISKVRIQ